MKRARLGSAARRRFRFGQAPRSSLSRWGSLIAAAARILVVGDALGALKRVGLRDAAGRIHDDLVTPPPRCRSGRLVLRRRSEARRKEPGEDQDAQDETAPTVREAVDAMNKAAAANGWERLRRSAAGATPKNDSAFKTMSRAWTKVVQNIGAIAGEQD